MRQKLPKNEQRSEEQIKEHYEIEKELANRLRQASKEERIHLYSSVYDELYRRVPLHPQLTRKLSSSETKKRVSSQMKFIKRFLNKKSTFLEIGAGDCTLSFEAANFVKQVYAVDVSNEIAKASNHPANFQLFLSDGCSIPVPPNSIDVAYSNQLIEHLHPEDAFEQLQNIYNGLDRGGIYICITSNRITGPNDISKYFDAIATGFHMKEYTTLELSNLFKQVGFSRVKAYVGAKGKYIGLPTFPVVVYEYLLDKFLSLLRKTITPSLLFKLLPDIRLIGMK